MRESDLRRAMDSAFGPGYARSLAADLSLAALGARTADEAIAAGVTPREVWDAICVAKDVPDAVRWAWREPPDPSRSR